MSEKWASLEFLYAETRDLLLRQLDGVEAIDSKAGIIAGFDGVIITASLGVLKDFSALVQVTTVMWQQWVFPSLVFAGIVSALVSLAAALVSYRIQTYKEVLAPRATYEAYLGQPEDETRLKLLHNLIDSYERNAGTLQRKAGLLTVSQFALLAAGILFSLAALAYLLASIR